VPKRLIHHRSRSRGVLTAAGCCAALAMLLAACGGNSGSGAAQSPAPPGATATAPATAQASPAGAPAAVPPPATPDASTATPQLPVAAPATAPAPTSVPVVIAPPPATSTPVPPPAAPVPGGGASVGGCRIFPPDNPWNQDISSLPVDANSATYIASINATGGNGFLHADFGGGGAYGIPYVVVPASQPLLPVNFTAYGDESDPGPYPVPQDAPIEGGGAGDAHVLAVQQGTCKLYEMYNAHPAGAGWDADSGAVFDLNSNALRPDSWTSADAAGLPILAGLVRYDEVQAGAIRHALRFTVGSVQRAWVHPATHYGTSSDPARPPYGARMRLKQSFDISGYHGQSRVVLEALRRYGMIVADQGSSWFITGAADARWDDDDLNQLKTVPGTMFEVVQLGPILRP
jgi:hypothetical protein